MDQKPPRIKEKLILVSAECSEAMTPFSDAYETLQTIPKEWDHSRSISSPPIVLDQRNGLYDYWERKRSLSTAHLDVLDKTSLGRVSKSSLDLASLPYTGMQRTVVMNNPLTRSQSRGRIFAETIVVSRVGTPAIDLTRKEDSRPASRLSKDDKPAVYAKGLIKINGRGVRLRTYDELPAWLTDNPHLLSGYRLYTTYTENWYSTLQWHNETVNIWTHWLGSLLFIGVIFYSAISLSPNATAADRAWFAFYSCTVSITLFLSGLFHTHYPTSERALVIFCSMDTAGISLLTAGSAMLISNYSMYCMKVYQGMWLGLLILVNLVGLVGPFFKEWTSPRFRIVRTIALLTAAGLSVAPVAMAIGMQGGIPNDWPKMTAVWIGVCVFCYLLGAFVYVFQIPERWAPGKFDYIGASHQIWHVLVVCAAASLYLAGFELFQWQYEHACNY
jgi:adiponectin receptor